MLANSITNYENFIPAKQEHPLHTHHIPELHIRGCQQCTVSEQCQSQCGQALPYSKDITFLLNSQVHTSLEPP